MNADERIEFICGLRQLAMLLDDHPELSIGFIGGLNVYLPHTSDRAVNESRMREWAQALRTFDKEANSLNFCLHRKFGALQFSVNVDRDGVCRKVTKTQTVEVWECPESLLSPELPPVVTETAAP